MSKGIKATEAAYIMEVVCDDILGSGDGSGSGGGGGGGKGLTKE